MKTQNINGQTYKIEAGWEECSNGNKIAMAKKQNGKKQYMIIDYGNNIYSVMGL